MSDTITKDAPKGVEVTVPVAAKPAAAPAVTDAELAAEGWTGEEIAAARKRGIVAKDEKKPGDKAKPAVEAGGEDGEDASNGERKPAAAASGKPKPAGPAEAAEEGEEGDEPAPAERKPASGIPELNLTEDQEKRLAEILPPGTPLRGIYFSMKRERQGRQKAEAELAKLREQFAARPGAAPGADAPRPGEDPAPGTDEDLDRPVTARMLREMKQREDEQRQREQSEQAQRRHAILAAHKDQEEYARSVYPDFDDTLTKAVEVMQNLETLVPPHRRAWAIELMQKFQAAAASADRFGIEDNHAAMIAYEVGRFHPDYGKTNGHKAETRDTGLPKDPKAPGGRTPEQLKRIEQQTQRRPSSAAVPAGGGRRVIAPEEVTADDLAGMDYAKRAAFREQYPDHYARIMRG